MRQFPSNPGQAQSRQGGFSGVQLLLMLLLTVLLSVGASFFIIRTYIFPAPLTPVTLSAKEQQRLEHKLGRLGWQGEAGPRAAANAEEDFAPEAYSESDAARRVTFSEKEVNAMIGRSPDFAHRIAIDFADNLASAKILLPIPQDFPIMAGQILRVNAGLDIHLDRHRRPVVALVGVSLMGVPIPNAWLGNMKNVNLVSEFGDRGFWNTFADGVEDLQIRDGELYIKLRR
ncbi:arginine N-succinyltransferase [Shewanella salipaludis]|uniref:Arginine N-succinyltransferase n=1 Tax=Shewanella salipaludis TaxID=2723052 RepID=A0A972FVM9_9GAMM|nr:arginine N-succinyltransferase [Shewanella salipaludis]NMH66596.1 arginine N-succinyltransferase [Shewanella salipaludis]